LRSFACSDAWWCTDLVRLPSAGALVALALAGCLASESQTPNARDDEFATGSPAPGRAGYLLEVDMRRRAVRVAAPTEARQAQPGTGPSFSILDGETIGLTVDNYAVSEVGRYSPGKVRVRFDVSVANQLPGLALVPPALGGDGTPRASLMLFPLLQSAKLTNGATAINEDGSILVNRRSDTVVEPSVDWNGDGTQPQGRGYDFVGDSSCAASSPGCTPWEALPSLLPGEHSPVRMVGFDLDPTVSEFRAWLLLAADLRSDTTVVSPPPVPTGTGIPFGPYGLFNLADIGGSDPVPEADAFTLGYDGDTPENLIFRIVAARARKLKLVLALTGGAHSLSNHGDYLSVIDGVLQFDRAKWDAKLARFNTAAIRSAVAEGVADGTILGASVMDEPYVNGGGDGNTWGPRGTMTKARVDSLCGEVKRYFPTLPTGVDHQHQLFEPEKSYHVCDFIVDQYGTQYGDVKAWRDAGLVMAARDGHAILFSMNVLDGGTQDKDGTWDCAGTGGKGTYAPNCRMTAAQVREAGQVLGPAGCALLMWQYDLAFMVNPANQQAFHDVAALLASLTAPSCRAR
jgi:hypothetical protein